MLKFLFQIIFILFLKFIRINSHGRLLDPPARSSAWRENPISFPIYYGDNQMFCGGFNTHAVLNKGRCGICGEDYSKPKEFEKGGRYYRGKIVRIYNQNEKIQVNVEITSNHKGYFEFRICNTDLLKGSDATHECLDKYKLVDKFGRFKIPVRHGYLGHVQIQLQLPSNLFCNHCVLQWKYHALNSWNIDPYTRRSCIGCGPQEEFYGCSDIKILPVRKYY